MWMTVLELAVPVMVTPANTFQCPVMYSFTEELSELVIVTAPSVLFEPVTIISVLELP